MPLYNKPSKELVYDLINEANPDLEFPITPTNAVLGLPTALSSTIPWPQSNTTIVASAAPGGGEYIGKQTLNYRRLDLAVLFRSMVITIRKYRDLTGLNSSSVVYTTYQLLPIINQQYGMNLTEDDVTNVGITRGTALENGFNTNTVTVLVKATSLGYIGSFQLKWINAPRALGDMLTVTEIPGRLFPGGNNFAGGNHPDILTPNAFGLDFSDLAATYLKAIGSQTVIDRAMNNPYVATDGAFFRAAFARINDRCGTSYKFTVDGTADQVGEFWLGTWSYGPSTTAAWKTTYPEINSADFNMVIIIKPPATAQWAVDYLVLGFNI